MAPTLSELHLDAHDPVALARFWAGVLGREIDPADPVVVLAGAVTTFPLRFIASREPQTLPNLGHPDLTSTSLEDQAARVALALRLGARHHDVGQGPDEDQVVLADPEGNEFCVTGPGGSFLAGCGLFGALSSDGTHAVGVFWSAALEWPLVWDQGEETAIQSPVGGTKISWGGTPLNPKPTRNRVRFHLTAAPGEGITEVARLVALGARAVRPPAGGRPAILLDPDGNEFLLSAEPA